LYERGAGAERRRFIVDAKNKARPKLVERLLWTSGARDALGVDGAYVASSGVRDATRRLAQRLRITVIDMQTLTARNSEKSASPNRLTREELGKLVGEADRHRDSKKWREHLHDTLAALLSAFGGSGANIALRSAGYFADQVLTASSTSPSRELATRLFYLTVSAAAVGLDYVASQTAYQLVDKQQQDVEEVVRYGSDHVETKRRLELALQVTRQYLPNGPALTSQLREKIASDSEAIPADVIAEVTLKMTHVGALFQAARDLEMAAYLRNVPAFVSLSAEARSFCGAVMDFFDLDREQVATMLGPSYTPPDSPHDQTRSDVSGGS
jgi:hypothetical protein